jgi:hypothetical protein
MSSVFKFYNEDNENQNENTNASFLSPSPECKNNHKQPIVNKKNHEQHLEFDTSNSSFQNNNNIFKDDDNNDDIINNEDEVKREIEKELTEDENSINDDNDDNNSEEEEEMTEESRLNEELRASELLAWEMMRADNMETYEMQVNYMRELEENSNEQISAEDFAAIQLAINEAGIHNGTVNEDERYDNSNNDDDDNDNDDDDDENWDYERLLALGQAIGDVKTERWRLRAKGVINDLVKMTYENLNILCKNNNNNSPSLKLNQSIPKIYSAIKKTPPSRKSPKFNLKVIENDTCAVCMERYENSEMISILPCSHYFHDSCTEGWLSDHNNCPCCKAVVSVTP